MTDYSYLHELESVSFFSDGPRKRSELLRMLTAEGFTLHDDVLSLDRVGLVPPWQHRSIVELKVARKGKECYGFKRGDWDQIVLEYLFAHLPFDCASRFLDTVDITHQRLGLVPVFRGQSVTRKLLEKSFAEMKDELSEKTGEVPGSESLVIFIQSTYPRCSLPN